MRIFDYLNLKSILNGLSYDSSPRSRNSLLQIQMFSGAIPLLLIWWSFVGFGAATCIPERCGSMNVSYPFWISNTNCGYPGFQIKCMGNSSGQSAPFLPTPRGDFQILDINYLGNLTIESTSLKAMSCNQTDDAFKYFELQPDGPFTISSENRFVVIGCNSQGSFNGPTNMPAAWKDGSCRSACLNQFDPPYCNCYGCCEAGIPGNWKWINFTGGGTAYDLYPGVCGFSTILNPPTWIPEESCRFGSGRYGMLLLWGVGNGNCSTTKGTLKYSCAEAAECLPPLTGEGQACKCLPGYVGNGYYNGTGCTDVDECADNDLNQCVTQPKGICHNLPGTYNCSCAKGYSGDGFQNGTRCQSTTSNNVVVPATIGSLSSFVAVSLVACGLFWWLRKRHLKFVKVKYFQQNGGIQLQQYIVSKGGRERESLKIYYAKELEKASNNYSNDMKLGSGGYGTVFKGILSDGTYVAIKKSKEISDVQEDEQFINEVIILSQLNHRNIVKLRGCCLETKFPLLVYEFVPNRTLYEHLHSDQEHLSWEIRLRIAIETAEALAYLHSAMSQPIFHRDVKSSNILLDKTFTPKVADFGISRLLNADDTHLTTNVMGTRGYMDPEYFQTFQLTDKSDVYSFGVVLAELLTGLAPLSLERDRDECTLSGFFLSKINKRLLTEILDPKAGNDENLAEMENMAKIARQCLHAEGRMRPSMKDVVEMLLWIRGGTRHTRLHEEIFEANNGYEGVSREPFQNKYATYSYPKSGESSSDQPSVALIEISRMDGR